MARIMTAERRAHLAAAAREQQVRRVRGEVIWTLDRISRLQSAFAAGRRQGAIAAFPEMRPSQVTAAIRRYCTGPATAPIGVRKALALASPTTSCWDDPEFHVRLLEALTDRKQLRPRPRS
jgi:hypothetical protein